MSANQIWTDEEFHAEQLLREKFGVNTTAEGAQIAWDMMGRLFAQRYCQPKRMPGGKKYTAQRFQDRWTQRNKPSQPFAKWARISKGPYTTVEHYLRVHLIESIQALAQPDEDNSKINLLTEATNRAILLGRGGIPARYALPYDELQMIHSEDAKLGRPDRFPQARSAGLRAIPGDRLINIHGGQVSKVEGINNNTTDVMICDYDVCAVCNEAAGPIPQVSRFGNMPFVHIARDCEVGIDPLQHFYTFRGALSAELAAPVSVPNQKQEIDVKVVVDGKEFIVAAVACVPESCAVCNELSTS